MSPSSHPAAASSERAPARRRPSLQARARWLLQPLPVALALGWALARGGPAPEPTTPLPAAVAAALARDGLLTAPADVHLVEPLPGALASRWHSPRVVFRAHRGDEPSDVYAATLAVSPEGRLIAVEGVFNVTDTSAVDERGLVVDGARAAWELRGAEKTYSVHFADFSGAATEPSDWTRLEQLQDRVTCLQETGSTRGILRRDFKLEPAASRLRVAFAPSALVIDADGRELRVPTGGAGASAGSLHLREESVPRARPGNLVTWAVDRARALPWFGRDRMQLVKAVAFDLLDRFERMRGTVTGDTGAERVAAELGGVGARVPVTYRDPETGWPPPPMKPILSHPLEGEGEWRALDGDHDPFIRSNPGAPAPFITSFIRTDRERPYTQVYVVEWDPRQVALHAMSGTVEPKSATGETGPGLVPREPAVMGRLVGAFNGGFQATHGEFGMMADGVVYLPPKPYAATVAELADGSTAFGTWPASDAVPAEVVSYRQNMTPLVLDGTINPYRRDWWGGVPPGWTDESRTVRSALCLTEERFVAYLYGSTIDAEHLALAMQRARCTYGLHLDMNAGHTGLEFYRAAPAGALPPLERKLDRQWEAEGEVPDMPGWRFRGRRMLRLMGLMNFPRYIHREARDFFYLTLRSVLPGEPVKSAFASPEPGEGAWQVKGLPQHGWPYALATAWVRPDRARPDAKVRLLALDPAAVRLSADEAAPTVLTLGAPRDRGPGLFLEAGRARLAATPPAAGAVRLMSGLEPDDPMATTATAAVGVDAAGKVLYAEVATATRAGGDARMLVGLLGSLGCERVLLLTQPAGVALGGQADLAGQPALAQPGGLRLARAEMPGGRRFFEDTPIVPPKVWYPLQSRRVRYFPKPKPQEPAAPSEPAP
ncbi:MAG: hypothetical protein OZ921_14995 [Sorangiineae bacterium]|nr:hypothetical protein [Polyangiaceae bacterium]MEB2323817.1 hypothetical protein [Sorangiineae bacterium]